MSENFSYGNWYRERLDNIRHMKAQATPRAEETYKLWEGALFQLTANLSLPEGTQVPVYSTGKITKIHGDIVELVLEGYGSTMLPITQAQSILLTYPEKSGKDLFLKYVNKTAGTEQVSELKAGSLVEIHHQPGSQYSLTAIDTKTGNAFIKGKDGCSRLVSIHELKLVEAPGDVVTPINLASGGAPSAGGTMPVSELVAGSKVQITGINPVYNSSRRYPVFPGEESTMIGQTGTVIAAFYPIEQTGGGSDAMYRVLFAQGGKKDFSSSELAPVFESKLSEDVADEGSKIGSPAAYKSPDKPKTPAPIKVPAIKKIGEEVVRKDGAVGVIYGMTESSYAVAWEDGSIESLPRATKNCTTCKSQLAESCKFCGTCGCKVDETAATEPPLTLAQVSQPREEEEEDSGAEAALLAIKNAKGRKADMAPPEQPQTEAVVQSAFLPQLVESTIPADARKSQASIGAKMAKMVGGRTPVSQNFPVTEQQKALTPTGTPSSSLSMAKKMSKMISEQKVTGDPELDKPLVRPLLDPAQLMAGVK